MTVRCLSRSLCLLAMFSFVTLEHLDAAPPIEWTRVFGSTEPDIEGGVAVDVFGNVYTVGGTKGSFPGFQNAGGMDCWLAKFSPSGKLLWCQQWGGPEDEWPSGVAVDRCGHAYVVESRLKSQTNAGKGFLRKYLCDGRLSWCREIRVSEGTRATGVAVTDGLEIYVIGQTVRPAFPDGAWMGYVRKFNHCGDDEWMQLIGNIPGTADEAVWPFAIVVDRLGNASVTGCFRGLLNNNQPSIGHFDAFVVKLNCAGKFEWTQALGTPKTTTIGRAITFDGCGNVLISGEVYVAQPGETVVDPRLAAEPEVERGPNDAIRPFLAKLDPQGTPQWRQPQPFPNVITGVKVRSGKIYVAGWDYAAGIAESGATVDWKITLPGSWTRIEFDHSGHFYLSGKTLNGLNGERPIGNFDAYLMKLTQ